MTDRENVSDAVPRWDAHEGKQWGQTPEPTMEPAGKPRAAKVWALRGLLLLALAALVVLLVAILKS